MIFADAFHIYKAVLSEAKPWLAANRNPVCANCASGVCCNQNAPALIHEGVVLAVYYPELLLTAKHDNVICPFFSNSNCSIYRYRPIQCRMFYPLTLCDKPTAKDFKARDASSVLVKAVALDKQLAAKHKAQWKGPFLALDAMRIGRDLLGYTEHDPLNVLNKRFVKLSFQDALNKYKSISELLDNV